ncbi:hypothetical protein N9980_01285 [bacterium]|nr:hypothetical protein [bacterium]
MPNLADISSRRRQVEAPLIEWVPDRPQFRNPGVYDMRNAMPSDNGLYKPIPSPVVESSNGLKDLVAAVVNNAGQVQSFRDPNNNLPYYYTAAVAPVGNTFHLFQYDEQNTVWTNVTPASPDTFIFGGHGYFSSFGDRVYGTSGFSAGLYAKDIGGVDLFASVTNAPRFKDAVVIRGFMFGINFIRTVSPFNTVTTGVSWSASNDPENWIDPSSNPIGALAVLRGETQLEGGGRLQRVLPGIGGADAIIFGQSKIWRVTFIGPPSVWDFQVVEEDEGTSMPTSVVSDGQLITFRGRRGWMIFDGAIAQPVGAGKVDYSFIRRSGNEDFAFNGAGLGAFNQGIRSALVGEPFTDSVAAFLFRSDVDATLESIVTNTVEAIVDDQGREIQASINTPFADSIILFNKLTGAWGNAKLSLQCIARVETDVTRTDAPRMVGLNQDLELVVFDGENLEARFDSTEVTGDVNNLVTVRHAWPFVNNNNCTIQLMFRNRLGDVQTIQDAKVLEEDASIPINESGRFVALRITMPQGEEWEDGFIGVATEFADLGIGGVL